MEKQLVFSMEDKYSDYLSDESKYQGSAESISFPETVDEIQEIVKDMMNHKIGITIQGGKSGIVGGGVPEGGHLMSLSHMNHVIEAEEITDGTARITVEAGLTLMDLNLEISRRFKKTSYQWPVQPSETTATIGGILASAAMGMNACHYGDCRKYVESLRVILADGSYDVVDNQESIYQMIGSEGIYGVICGATLILVSKPESIWGISFFFEREEDAFRFGNQLPSIKEQENECAWIEAAEYLDHHAIQMIEQQKPYMSKIKEVPEVPECTDSMVYIELAGQEEAIEELAMIFMDTAGEFGSDPETAWAVSGETEVEKMRNFRHAAAETANLFIEKVQKEEPQIRKLGTDMSVLSVPFQEMAEMYRKGIQEQQLSYSMFGHMLENHLHINILPTNMQEYEAGKQLIRRWAEQIAKESGDVAAENGIGKLKKELSDLKYTSKTKEQMMKKKSEMDALGLWNKGNIF